MVSTFEVEQYVQFHARVLQKRFLSKWDKLPVSLDSLICLGQMTRASVLWSPSLQAGRSLLPLLWTLVMTDASLFGWRGGPRVEVSSGLLDVKRI